MEVLNFITVILLTIIGAIEKYSALIKYIQHLDLFSYKHILFLALLICNEIYAYVYLNWTFSKVQTIYISTLPENFNEVEIC